MKLFSKISSIRLTMILIGLLCCVEPILAQGGQTHIVAPSETLSLIAAKYNVPAQAIMAVNSLDNPDMLVAGQRLIIPPIRATTSDTNAVKPTTTGGDTIGTYTVRPGDILSAIAAHFGTSIENLAAMNSLSGPDVIVVGQVLKVPLREAQQTGSTTSQTQGSSQAQTPSQAPATYQCGGYYTIRAGDTLSDIALAQGVTIQAIIQTNNLAGETIYADQKLCVPNPSTSVSQASRSSPAPKPTYHIVQVGDTLSDIAWKYGVSVATLMQASGLSDASYIWVGQKLHLSGRAYSAKAQTRSPEGDQAKQTQEKPKKQYHHSKEPSYVPPRDYPDTQPYGCFNPQEAYGPVSPPRHKPGPPAYNPNPQQPPEMTVVRTVNKWCAVVSYSDDPDGLTMVDVSAVGRPGEAVHIQVDHEVLRVTSGGFYDSQPEAAWHITGGPKTVHVFVQGERSEKLKLDLPAGKRAYVIFKYVSVTEEPRPRSVTGWSARIINNTGGAIPGNGVSSVIVIHAGAVGIPISIRSEGHDFRAVCHTGTKPEHGAGACEFGGLWPGKYTLAVEGAGISAEVYVDGVGMAEILFDHS